MQHIHVFVILKAKGLINNVNIDYWEKRKTNCEEHVDKKIELY